MACVWRLLQIAPITLRPDAGLAFFLAVIAAAGVYSFVETGEQPASTSRPETATAPATTPAPAVPAGHGFDFYVLSLSWSPSFCASENGARNRQQCGEGAALGLIVHGLWPQNETGYPEFCPSGEPERVPDRLGRQMQDIMPGMGLVGHQWRKHGTCSGLTQPDYFRVVRAAHDAVKIPAPLRDVAKPERLAVDAIETAFAAANPELSRQGIAVTCEDGRLDEIRICLSKSLEFRDCREVDRRSCPLPAVAVPASR